MISPNGGEAWNVGSSQTITWNSGGTITNVKIEYSTDGGSSWSTIVASTTNDGSHPWTVPAAPSSNCLVRISDAADGDPSDVSDGTFTIATAQSITVTSPNGGEAWNVGSTQTITWNSTGTIANVKIQYSPGGGSFYIPIVDSTPNDGSYTWTVPNMPSTNCLIMILDAADSDPSDVSDAAFTIATAQSITVTSPNGGEVVYADSTYAITWTSTGTINNVKIQYSPGGGSFYIPIVDSTPNDGSYTWTVPDFPSTNCLIMVLDAADSDPSDVSDAAFTIATAQSITVTSPNGGEVVYVDSTYAITWTSTGTIDSVKIQYSTDGGSFWSIIVASTQNNGSHTWTVPDAPSTNCLVRVLDAADNDPWDESDGAFEIVAPSITVTSPNGGETWEVGSTQTITWNSAGTIPNAKIEYSTNSGSSWNTIVSSTTNDGSHTWTVPDAPSNNCLVKISDAADNDPSDVSDGLFVITYVPLGDVMVTSPNGGEIWGQGSNRMITWTSTGGTTAYIDSVRIRIYLRKAGAGSWGDLGDISIDSTPNDGSYLWTVPGVFADSCTVSICGITQYGYTLGDFSDGPFEIVPLWQYGATEKIVSLSESDDSESDDLQALRRYRDEVLNQTPVAAELVRRLYEHSYEVSEMLLRGDALAERVRDVIVRNMDGVRRMLEGDTVALQDALEVDQILADVAEYASSSLQDLIRDVRKELREDRTVEQFGFQITEELPIGVQAEEETIPESYALLPCHPNPFNVGTIISYNLPEASDVTLTIYAVTGQKIAVLVNAHKQAGHHRVLFDGSGFGTGVYLCRLKAGTFIQTRKMVLIK